MLDEIVRRKTFADERSYRTTGYPFTPILFICGAVWFIINTLISKPEQAVAGLIFLGIGAAAFYFWKFKE